MPTTIEISMDGSIQGTGTIDYAIKNLGKDLQIPDLFRDLISGFMRMAAIYKDNILGDGRLFGDERFQLVEILDEVIGESVLLRQLIDTDERRVFSLIHKGYGYNISFQVSANRWDCTGNLGSVKSINISKFSKWMEHKLAGNLSELIKKMKEAYEDGVLTSQEKLNLQTTVDKILFGVILVRKSILSGEMD